LNNKKVNIGPPLKNTHQQNHCKINLHETPTTTIAAAAAAAAAATTTTTTTTTTKTKTTPLRILQIS
jgi:hypothetical protein